MTNRTHPAQVRSDFSQPQTKGDSMTYTNQLQSAGDMHERLVQDLFKDMGSLRDNMMHAAAGISGEGGELLDAVKKHWAYGKPLDVENVVEELGDLEFYMRALRNLVGVTREHVLLANIVKLQKRYPQGKYSDQQAQDRADKLEVIGDFDKAAEDVEITNDPEIQAIMDGKRL